MGDRHCKRRAHVQRECVLRERELMHKSKREFRAGMKVCSIYELECVCLCLCDRQELAAAQSVSRKSSNAVAHEARTPISNTSVNPAPQAKLPGTLFYERQRHEDSAILLKWTVQPVMALIKRKEVPPP